MHMLYFSDLSVQCSEKMYTATSACIALHVASLFYDGSIGRVSSLQVNLDASSIYATDRALPLMIA